MYLKLALLCSVFTVVTTIYSTPTHYIIYYDREEVTESKCFRLTVAPDTPDPEVHSIVGQSLELGGFFGRSLTEVDPQGIGHIIVAAQRAGAAQIVLGADGITITMPPSHTVASVPEQPHPSHWEPMIGLQCVRDSDYWVWHLSFPQYHIGLGIPTRALVDLSGLTNPPAIASPRGMHGHVVSLPDFAAMLPHAVPELPIFRLRRSPHSQSDVKGQSRAGIVFAIKGVDPARLPRNIDLPTLLLQLAQGTFPSTASH
jgi:hypothetical protein